MDSTNTRDRQVKENMRLGHKSYIQQAYEGLGHRNLVKRLNFRNRFQSKGSGHHNSHSRRRLDKHSSSKQITEIDSSSFLDKKGAHSISIGYSPRKKEIRQNLSS